MKMVSTVDFKTENCKGAIKTDLDNRYQRQPNSHTQTHPRHFLTSSLDRC